MRQVSCKGLPGTACCRHMLAQLLAWETACSLRRADLAALAAANALTALKTPGVRASCSTTQTQFQQPRARLDANSFSSLERALMVPFSHPVSRRRRFRSKDMAVTRQLPWASTQRMRRAPVMTCREGLPLVRRGAQFGGLHGGWRSVTSGCAAVPGHMLPAAGWQLPCPARHAPGFMAAAPAMACCCNAHLPHTDGTPLVSADHLLVGIVEQHAGNGLQMLDSAIIVMLAHRPSLQGRQPVAQAGDQSLEAPGKLRSGCCSTAHMILLACQAAEALECSA